MLSLPGFGDYAMQIQLVAPSQSRLVEMWPCWPFWGKDRKDTNSLVKLPTNQSLKAYAATHKLGEWYGHLEAVEIIKEINITKNNKY